MENLYKKEPIKRLYWRVGGGGLRSKHWIEQFLIGPPIVWFFTLRRETTEWVVRVGVRVGVGVGEGGGGGANMKILPQYLPVTIISAGISDL